MTPSHDRRSPILAVCCVLAAAALAHAVQLDNGRYYPDAIPWLIAAVAFAWAGWLTPRWRIPELTFIACIAVMLWEIFQSMTAMPMEGSFDPYVPFYFWALAMPILAGAAIGAALLDRWRNWLIGLLLVCFFLTGAWLLHKSRPPSLDVYESSKDACHALLHGVNPYAIDFPNLFYDPRWEGPIWPPGSVVNGRVKLGFPYMPLDLEIESAGYLLGDFRIANLLAMTFTAALIAFCRPGRLSAAAAGLLLLMPRSFYVIQQGWVEPIVACGVAAVVVCACRYRTGLPWALGLLMVSKQHLLFVLAAMPLLLPRPWISKQSAWFCVKALGIGALVTLPLVIWDLRAFWHSAVYWHLTNPFRSDSLNFSAAWVAAGHATPPDWLAFAVAIFSALVVIRAPRTPSGFAAAVAIIYLCFFVTAKQAFCNYYYLIIAMLCCAIAAYEPEKRVVS